MHLFYDAQISEQTSLHFLNESEAHHAIKVLHLCVGNTIGLLNGRGMIAKAIIVSIQGKKCSVEIIERTQHPLPHYHLHLAIAPTKNNDRMDFFVEKACEIGATHITFLNTQHAIRKTIKIERYQNIAISAIKQSQRLFLPEITGLVILKDFVAQHPNGYIAHCRAGEKRTLIDIFDGNGAILIGPEGDFSQEEITIAIQNGYHIISLGNNRLRTETSGIYACVQAMSKIEQTLKK